MVPANVARFSRSTDCPDICGKIWLSYHPIALWPMPQRMLHQGTGISHHEVTEHVGDGHPCAALDYHQQHQGPEEDLQGGCDAFPQGPGGWRRVDEDEKGILRYPKKVESQNSKENIFDEFLMGIYVGSLGPLWILKVLYKQVHYVLKAAKEIPLDLPGASKTLKILGTVKKN